MTATEVKAQPAWESLQLSGPVYDAFMNNIRSEVTKYNYTFAIKKLMQFVGVEKIEELLPANWNSNANADVPPTYADIRRIESTISSYLSELKKDGVSRDTAKGYLSAYILFFDVNGYTLIRKRLARSLPDKRNQSKDRGYSKEEIARMLDGADERLRALILLLACTGMRIGAIADERGRWLLQRKHLHFIEEQGYKLYKLIIYEGTDDEYFCFTTPEATAAIDTYLKYRERHREKLTPDSYLFREQFNTEDEFDCKNPRPMREKGLSKLILTRATRVGVRDKTPMAKGEKPGKRRNKVFSTSGFRKFLTTTMESAEIPTWAIEKQLGHRTGIGVTPKHYSRHEEQERLSLYLKAVDALTINDERRLKTENEMLKVKKSEFEALKEQVAENKRSQHDIFNVVAALREHLGIPPDKNIVWDMSKKKQAQVSFCDGQQCEDPNLMAGLRKKLGIPPDKNVVWDWTKPGGVSVYDEEEYNRNPKHKPKGPVTYYRKEG